VLSKKAVFEPVVAELVEASKRPQGRANEGGGFDRLNHRIFEGILWLLSLSKHRNHHLALPLIEI